MITLYFSAPDGSWTREAKTIEQARSIFNYHVGSGGVIGSTYAVSNDGIVTCYADGCDLSDLLPRDDWHEDQGNGWSAADHYAEDLEYN